MRCNGPGWSSPPAASRWHSVGGSTLNSTQWNNFSQTDGENHRTFLVSDLLAGFLPNFAANVGVPIAGVMTDFHGNARPASGTSLAGAVIAVGPGDSGDVNGDGLVNVFDLLGVIVDWGACGSCPPDVNHDGLVNAADLLMVITEWG